MGKYYGILRRFFFGKSNKDIEREMRYAEDLGIDEPEGLKNKEIRKEKLANYEYYTKEGEDL